LKRRFLRSAAVAAPLLLLAAFAFPRLGGWLVVQDPLQEADAIFVLGGTRFERPLEAVDLYNERWAPRILLMRQISDWGEVTLMERGVPYQREIDVQVDVLTRLGVPAAAIEILGEQDSTAQEADTLLAVAGRHGWRRIIVVTGKQHTRRARLVLRRRLAGTGIEVIVRPTRYDRSDTEHWWRNRSTLRFTLFETQRYAAYLLGIAD
jgi:uncharacterized SAM-binding protein YcdF (DUF218 family)